MKLFEKLIIQLISEFIFKRDACLKSATIVTLSK